MHDQGSLKKCKIGTSHSHKGQGVGMLVCGLLK